LEFLYKAKNIFFVVKKKKKKHNKSKKGERKDRDFVRTYFIAWKFRGFLGKISFHGILILQFEQKYEFRGILILWSIEKLKHNNLPWFEILYF